MIDDEPGRWLLETTGDARMTFGGWELADLRAAIGSEEPAADETAAADSAAESDVEAEPVFDDLESVVNSLSFSVDAGAMRELDARFSGIYPESAVPTATAVRESLVGDEDVPHEIVVDGNRVHATASFETSPFE